MRPTRSTSSCGFAAWGSTSSPVACWRRITRAARAGIPLIDGLRDLRDSMENPRFREVLTSVIEDMEGGKVLSQCLAAHPEIFSVVFVSLVRAGELAGTLPEVFESLAASLRWQD